MAGNVVVYVVLICLARRCRERAKPAETLEFKMRLLRCLSFCSRYSADVDRCSIARGTGLSAGVADHVGAGAGLLRRGIHRRLDRADRLDGGRERGANGEGNRRKSRRAQARSMWRLGVYYLQPADACAARAEQVADYFGPLFGIVSPSQKTS